jgi:spermidine/putrescine-binding protein
VMKPEYKGKVVMVGGMLGNIQVWARVVTGTDTPTLITPAQLKETIDFMIKIKKEQARTVAASYGELVDLMARGEAVISTLGWEPVVKWAAKKGAKVAYVYPKEGTGGFLDCYVMPRNAPNRDVNLKLIDNALSLAGQKLIAEKMGQAIVNVAAIAALDAEERALYPYDNMAAMTKVAQFYPMPPLEPDGVHATFRDMLKEWDRFKRE